MSVRVIKDAAGVAQNKVAILRVTGLSLPADIKGLPSRLMEANDVMSTTEVISPYLTFPK